MALSILSNYSDIEQALDTPILEVESVEGGDVSINGAKHSYSVSGWLPGKDLRVKMRLRTNKENGYLFINWYCPATHLRGWLYSENEKEASGIIEGDKVRNRVIFSPVLIDRQGRTLAQAPKVTLQLEGREAYFPAFASDFDGPEKRAFCRLVLDPSLDPDSLFSRESLHTEFNRASRFCDFDSGMPADEAARFFAGYEIWRQLIETMLNNVDEFGELRNHLPGDEDRISTAVSSVLKRVFPGKSLEEIRRFRREEYPGFCARLQNLFFYEYYFNPIV